ncbi:MAG TPA: ABC-type transport auxiliary lipoprotein family protein [Desulfobaccales bacterium]|nr:ABC-type transport auxiliary lipoprotein family protein [Desulfobaccales bacterium]
MKAMRSFADQPQSPAASRPYPWMSWPWLFSLLAILLVPLLDGCGKPPMLVHRYILDYPAPVLAPQAKIPAAIMVKQFSVAQAFNTNAMVYQPQPFRSETYNYSRWRVNPGYLVSDYLLRDLRQAHLFRAVYGPETTSRFRFQLEGTVDDFQELDEPGGWQAVLGLTVTLVDVSQEKLPRRVVFQKNYRAVEPMPEKTPQGLAQAMSQAMARLSSRIITDTAQAARRRTTRPRPAAP